MYIPPETAWAEKPHGLPYLNNTAVFLHDQFSQQRMFPGTSRHFNYTTFDLSIPIIIMPPPRPLHPTNINSAGDGHSLFQPQDMLLKNEAVILYIGVPANISQRKADVPLEQL